MAPAFTTTTGAAIGATPPRMAAWASPTPIAPTCGAGPGWALLSMSTTEGVGSQELGSGGHAYPNSQIRERSEHTPNSPTEGVGSQELGSRGHAYPKSQIRERSEHTPNSPTEGVGARRDR